MSSYWNPDSSFTWADEVFDDRRPRPFRLPHTLPESGQAFGHPKRNSQSETKAVALASRSRDPEGTATLVSTFTVTYRTDAPDRWLAPEVWDALVAALPFYRESQAKAVEALRWAEAEDGEAEMTVEVEQWVVLHGARPACGLVVLDFENGLRIGHAIGEYSLYDGTGGRQTRVEIATRAFKTDTKRVPVLRFAPRPHNTTLSPEDQQARVDTYVVGLLHRVIASWFEEARGRVERERTNSRVEAVLAQDEDRFRQMGRCVYPLVDIGWRYSGRIRWEEPSQTFNDDDSWYLEADPETGQPGVAWLRGFVSVRDPEDPAEDYDDSYGDEDDQTVLPPAGLCGAQPVDADGLCAIHAGLPYINMNAKAWERARAAIRARQQAAVYADQAWGATEGRKRTFWTGDYAED